MFDDLDLHGKRYSISIFIFTIVNVVFKLPSTVAVRLVGPRLWLASTTFCFGVITLCTAFIHTWGQMIALRVLLGVAMSGIYPSMTYLVSVWYTRREQQLRFAAMQSGEVLGLATGNIVNYALNHLHGKGGLEGWRWMFLVQGLIACVIGIGTYWWMIDFPEQAHRSFRFLTEREAYIASQRVQHDRGDVVAEPFSWSKVWVCFADPKLYGFSVMFFSVEFGVDLPKLFPLNHPAIWDGILQQCIHHPVHSAILLGRYPRPFHLHNRRRLPHPRSSYHLQLLLSHRWVLNAGPPLSSQSPLHRHLPRHWCIRLQLGGAERIHGQQYCLSMEASHRCSGCGGVQWPRRRGGELYRERAGGATVSDCCVGVCWLTYSYDWGRGCVYGVLFSV